MKKRRAKAQIYDQIERANDYGLGHPGPLRWRRPRAKVNGNAARMRRLRKQAPQLHAKVLDGELAGGEATTMAGFNQRKPVRTRTRSITFSQEQELWLGPSHRGSVFKDDEERQRAWFSNRDRLMELFAHNGYRPMAYWRYESPVPWPGFCLAKSTLWAAGLLGENEARQLEETWRVEFDRSREPNFTFNDGPRGMLSGWAAHVAHLVYCDVPADLAERWAALDDAA